VGFAAIHLFVSLAKRTHPALDGFNKPKGNPFLSFAGVLAGRTVKAKFGHFSVFIADSGWLHIKIIVLLVKV
jgi:hypothetical protein